MKTFKKLTALFVAVVFVLSSLTGVSVFAADSSFTDVEQTNAFSNAIYTLVAEGVINGYEDGTFKPDATITRAEFSKLLAVSSAPRGTMFTATTTQFSDLADSSSPSAWAIPYVSYAVGIKAINGYEDGTFKPTNPVTYGEAIKMIVCTLGYGAVVDTTLTPWYQGYINIAMQIGLTKGAMSVGDNPAPRGLVAQLIYNMRNCKQLVNSGIGADGKPSFKIDDGDSYDNTDSDEGILLGVFDFCLTGDGLTKTQVLIDDEIYQLGDCERDDLVDLVGYSVSYKYVKGSKPELTKVTKNTGDNEIIEIEEWQVAELTGSYIDYYEDEDAEYDDDATTIKFADDFYVVYNGVVVPPSKIDEDFIENYLNVENGTLQLLSNDGNDKTAEVAFVESYITYFVNTSSTSEGVTTFYDKFTKHTGLEALSLDEDDVVSVKKVTKAGGTLTDVGLTAITAKSVTSVALPYGTKEGTIVRISTAYVEDTVKEISNDYSYVKLGAKEYKFSPYYHLLRDKGEDVELSINDKAKFYLDYQDRIVYFEKSNTTNPYALLVKYTKGTGMDAACRVHIVNSSKGTNPFTLRDNVRVNGEGMSPDEAIEFLKKTAPNYDEKNETFIIQPIKYKASGTEITEIECMDYNNWEKGNIVPYQFKNTVNTEKDYFANGGTLSYDKSGFAFKHSDDTIQFRMNSSTVVLVVPNDLTKSDSYKNTRNSYFSSETKPYTVEAYDMNNEIARVVVCYATDSNSTPSFNASTPVYLVQEITDKNNEDGQPTKNISYYKAGSSEVEEKLVANETAVLDKVEDINPGDLIKFVVEDGEIADIRKVYVDNELSDETGSFKKDGRHIHKSSDGNADYYQVILGTVRSIEVDGTVNSISIIPSLATDDDFDTVKDSYIPFTKSALTGTAYYKYTEKDGFKVADVGEIKAYSDYEDADEDGTFAKKTASRVLTIVVDKKIVAVYILGE